MPTITLGNWQELLRLEKLRGYRPENPVPFQLCDKLLGRRKSAVRCHGATNPARDRTSCGPPSKDAPCVKLLDSFFRENVNDYPCVMLNKDWGVRPGVLVNRDGLHVLTCKSHNGGRDKLVLYPSMSPHLHGILNCPLTD